MCQGIEGERILYYCVYPGIVLSKYRYLESATFSRALETLLAKHIFSPSVCPSVSLLFTLSLTYVRFFVSEIEYQ